MNALVAAIEKAEVPSVAEEEAEEDLMQEPEVLEVGQGHPQMARWAGGRRVAGGHRMARMSLENEIRQFWARPVEEDPEQDADAYLIATDDTFAYKLTASYTHS